ncbi:hypothetical protein DDZ13_10740 [Coraliomargarita sinensis]|uniref:PEP-CTERM protein-sorting domain-containing protein n=1 Tax=Coraliomargarita sinensis TaxID=2174842 RepID=A0A317ZK79_9BACT|nr:hypothetical protein [Coraliomargarita sinensis]PXA03761.1 hypothetical protein DDZ13_10740 [Coraliomargarita sinensis]
MKNKIILLSTCLAAGSALQAQNLIAGFDFDTALTSSAANYSDLGNGGAVNDGTNAAPFGSFSFVDGNSGSNPFPVTQLSGNNDVTAGTTLNSSIRVTGFNDTFATTGTGSLLAEDIGIATADGGYFDFAVSAGALYQNFSFGFAAGQTQGGTTSLNIGYSTDGGSSFTSLGNEDVTALTSNGGEAFSFDATGFQASDVIFRVNFTDIDTGTRFDNIQVSGTAVPEPSAFAAIAGLLAVASVSFRRCRK